MTKPGSRLFVLFCCSVSLMLTACQRDEPPPVPETRAAAEAPPAVTPQDVAGENVDITIPLRPDVVTRCVAASGGVETTVFTAGQPVELLMALAEAPAGLKVAAVLLDSKDAVVARADMPAEGKQSVTVALQQKIDPGVYKLDGYWGGNLVCEHDITVQ